MFEFFKKKEKADTYDKVAENLDKVESSGDEATDEFTDRLKETAQENSKKLNEETDEILKDEENLGKESLEN
jgi:histidinol dehydrogenase